MKRVSVTGSVGLLLMLCIACANSGDASGRADAGAREREQQPQEEDAGPEVSSATSLDLRSLLIAALIETERSLLARCPCLTADGLYKTMQHCVNAVSLGRAWVECANATDLTGLDDATVRAKLRCSLEELAQRSECLMGSSCSPEAVSLCMSQSLGCDMLPLDVLSHVAVECSIGFSH